MNIRKRARRDGSMSFTVQVRVAGHPNEVATFDTLKEAKTWGKKTEAEILAGQRSAAAKLNTLEGAIDRYLEEVLPTKRSQACPRGYLLWWRGQLGTLPLSDVTPSRISECLTKLAATTTKRGPMKGSTVNRYFAALSSVLGRCVRGWDLLLSNPCDRVPKYKESEGRVRYLSEDELERLLSALEAATDSPHLLPIVWVAISTGLRKSSVLELTWDRVDLEAGRVRIQRTKNGSSISIPLVGPALEALGAWSIRDGVQRIGLLFPSLLVPGKPIEIGKTFPAVVKAAGIDDLRFHDLRHCTGSFLAMSGATPSEIAAVLGHKQLSMVHRYSHVGESHTQEVVERMSAKFLSGAGSKKNGGGAR